MSFYPYKTGLIDEWLAACRSGDQVLINTHLVSA
jgi:hypothetical protein